MSLNQTPSSERTHIALFGKRNVGKSSVINAITNQQLSIVSEYEGTTTDPVYKAMEILPMGPVVLIDTAGLDDEGSLGKVMTQFSFTDFHVGDTIDIVDVKKLRDMISERMEKENVDHLEADDWLECREQLLEKGAYKTYIVEGILDDNANYMESEFAVVLPLERYYEFTGTDEGYVTGMRYHVEGDLSNQDLERITGVDLSLHDIKTIMSDYWMWSVGNQYIMSDYPYMVVGIGAMKNAMKSTRL